LTPENQTPADSTPAEKPIVHASQSDKRPAAPARRDLTSGPILSTVLRLAWPMVVGNVLQNAFNVVDMIFVGRLGPEAIAAVALCGLLMQISWTLLVGVSIGTTAMVSRFYGAGDTGLAGVTAMQSLSLGLLASALLVVFVNLAGRGALVALGASGGVVELGTGYLRIVFNGSFTLILFFLSSAIMRGTGDALSPMLIMAAATAVNVTLDPVLIFGLGPFPEMGVRGAAVATVIAQGLGTGAGLLVLSTGRTRLHLPWRRYRLDFDIIRRMLRLSGPGTVQGAVRSLGNLLLMRIVTSFGVLVVAAYGIGLRLDLIIMMPGWALGAAAAALVGQNLGAGSPARAERSAWAATALYVGLLAVIGTFLFLVSGPVIQVFNSTPEIVTLGSSYLRVRVAGYVFLALGLVLANALNGAGDTIPPMVILAASLVGVQVPLAWVLPRLLGGRPLGIWLAITAAFVLQGTAMAGWFLRGRWKHKRI
jgi:putative MATE family efflux protein